MTVKIKCSTCNGAGQIPDPNPYSQNPPTTCPACHGRGYFEGEPYPGDDSAPD